MNLRTLKKLSKRAAPLLPLLGDRRKQFRAEKDDNYTGLLLRDRKHFERRRTVHGEGRWGSFEGEIKRPAADGSGWVYMRPPSHPRKGTIMVGAISGYYEPEWDEETAWEALSEYVFCHFTDWSLTEPVLLRRLDTPRAIFTAARDIIAATGGAA